MGVLLSLVLCVCGVMGVAAADSAANASDAAATQPAGHLIVEGQVFDHIGSGVRGVDVRVFARAGGELKELGNAVTDHMGDFKVFQPSPFSGEVVVRFTRAGFKQYDAESEVVAGDYPPFIDHELVGDLCIRGEVRDYLTLLPVADANVVVSAGYSEWTAKTDAAGEFEVKDLSPSKGRITIDAGGFAKLVSEFEIGVSSNGLSYESLAAATTQPATSQPTASQRVAGLGGVVPARTFVLKPERIVHLTVTDAEGKPVPKVIVESLVESANDFRTGATDEKGCLDIGGLSIDAENMECRLTHADYVSKTSFDRVIELPPEKTESSHTLVMERGTTITGTVSGADGRPLRGARIVAGNTAEPDAPPVWSEFDGSFALPGVPPGDVVITVNLADHAPGLYEVRADPKAPTSLDIVLTPAAEVIGRVVDPDGKPVAGAHVLVEEWREHRTLVLQAMTDGEGRFVLRDAPADEFLVGVRAPGLAPLSGQPVRAGQGEVVLKFTGVRAASPGTPSSKLKTGEPAPAFEVTALDGNKIKLDDYRGKFLFVDFWATWCGPCVAEIPHMVELHKKLGGRDDFVVLSVSLDFDDKALRKFVRERKMVWTHVFGEKAGADKMAEAYGAVAIPATFLVGPDGKILAVNLGGKELVEQVRKLVDEAKAKTGVPGDAP